MGRMAPRGLRAVEHCSAQSITAVQGRLPVSVLVGCMFACRPAIALQLLPVRSLHVHPARCLRPQAAAGGGCMAAAAGAVWAVSS